MERIRYKKIPSTILCSDMHFREDTPVCWIGDFQKEQWTAVEFISKLQEKYDCIVIHAGDLFDHWKPSPWLLSRAIEMLPRKFYSIYGQHDLPQHNLELDCKSGLNTLRQAGVVKYLERYHYGQEDITIPSIRSFNGRDILVWHHLTYMTAPFPGATGGNAISILKKYPQFDLIVTGDNHESFWTEYQGRILVNPGCMTRQTAD